jgi:branched-chain amino acid aminotransferase
MVAYDGVIFSWVRHFQRLEESAEKLSLTVPDRDQISEAIQKTLVANDLTIGRARVRLSVGGGENPLTGGAAPGHVIVSATSQPDPAAFAKLVISPYSLNENDALAGIKSSSYGANLIAYRHAHSHGSDEALMLNTQGNLCEGATSNVFLVHGEQVLTPSLESGCLPGVTRAIVIEICESLSLPVEESDLNEHDLGEATEIFLTSSAREVQPATMHMDARGCPCAITDLISAAYQDLISREVHP